MEVQFALPTISTMTRDDQHRLLLSQAVAVIISAYLDHAARVNQTNPDSAFRFTAAELVTLINDVQSALRFD